MPNAGDRLVSAFTKNFGQCSKCGRAMVEADGGMCLTCAGPSTYMADVKNNDPTALDLGKVSSRGPADSDLGSPGSFGKAATSSGPGLAPSYSGKM
jgi:hypothetical protein